MPLVKRTPMALEIDSRDFTNRVCSDAVCYVAPLFPMENKPSCQPASATNRMTANIVLMRKKGTRGAGMSGTRDEGSAQYEYPATAGSISLMNHIDRLFLEILSRHAIIRADREELSAGDV
jgi:hypothetical protein